MNAGDVVGGRFEIRHRAAAGGMGIVYQAFDRKTDEVVALKVLPPQFESDEVRFRREGMLLDELNHPGIVRYIASGTTGDGSAWLAIEWLEGEDLHARLRREGLTIEQSLKIAASTASALGAAHARGIVHRDVKPANIFLVDGDAEKVKVLDFGIAHSNDHTQGMTKTGVMIGTLGYMAPEQARGEKHIDGRVDIFALGCVLFECITGQAAFQGERPVAVLAKILFEDTPHLHDVKPELSTALDELVGYLMAKDPDERPADAMAVVRSLSALDPLTATVAPVRLSTDGSLTGREKQYLSIILLSPREGNAPADTATLLRERVDGVLEPLRALFEPLGVRISSLASGQLMATLTGCGMANDQAARAAACALALRDSEIDLDVALATGYSEFVEKAPVGEVIDRVAALLDASAATRVDGVLTDDVTARLLDVHFAVKRISEDTYLLTDEPAGDKPRLLLGKPTPCVGRQRELTLLESVLTECVEEEEASVVLITARAGVGKSRLLQEFLARSQKNFDEVTVLMSRGDPVYAGSSLSIASQLAWNGLLRDDAPDSGDAYDRIVASVGRHFEGEDAQVISEFLGELIGTSTTAPPSPQYRAAQNDPHIKSEQLSAAFESWLVALSSEHPVVVVVEDLHWADLASLTFIDRVIRRNPESPLMVLALARPEVNDQFPDLWNDAGLQKIGLSGLRKKPSEKLVREVLGEETPQETIDRIVEQARGNAFYLEELIRHVAERGGEDFPETVLAMAQSRLDGLEAPARQILRAASIFGRRFWQAGVCELLGAAMTPDDVDAWLGPLIDGEIIERSREARFAGEREYAFRHDLLRQTAYSMLTDKDRTVGHQIAAEWLVDHGERSSLALAEHFEKGGQIERAVPYFVDAAQAALDGGNLEATLDISERGLAAGAEGEARGELLLAQVARKVWKSEFEGMSDLAGKALEHLPEGSPEWFQALAGFAIDGSFGGNQMAIMKVLGTMNSFKGELPAIGPVGYAAHAMNVALVFLGQYPQAKKLFERLEAAANAADVPDQSFLGYIQLLPVWHALYGFIPIGEGVRRCEAALQHFQSARSEIARAAAQQAYGDMLLFTGDLERCEKNCEETAELSRSLGLGLLQGWVTWTHGYAQGVLARPAEGLATLEPLLSSADSSLVTSAKLATSMICLLDGQYDEAIERADAVLKDSGFFPPRQAESLAVLAGAMLGKGESEKALEHADQSLDLNGRAGMQPLYESTARLTRIEALTALDRHDEAAEALTEARARLEDQCASLARASESFRNHIPPNAKILGLAEV